MYYTYRRPVSLALRSARPMLQVMNEFWNAFDTQGTPNVAHDAIDAHTPTATVRESATHYTIALDMPGVDASTIDIEVRDEQLIVQAQRPRYELADDEVMHVQEHGSQAFYRAFRIPSDMQADAAEARYVDGVLQLTMPKVAEAPATKIRVKDAKGGFIERMLGKKSECDSSTCCN